MRQFSSLAGRGREAQTTLKKDYFVKMNKATCSLLNNKNTHPHTDMTPGFYYQLSHTVVLLAPIQD